MARLVDVYMGCGLKYDGFKEGRLPISIDRHMSFVMNMDRFFLLGKGFVEPTKDEMKEFSKKMDLLSQADLEALYVPMEEVFSIITQLVPCIGCRKSAEDLYEDDIHTVFPSFYPMVIDKDGRLRFVKQLLNPKFLCSVFQSQNTGGKMQSVLDSMVKCKPGKRCPLHSMDSQRVRSVSSWLDVWEFMNKTCQKQSVMLDKSRFFETLKRYLAKHRFCRDCKENVQTAYKLLVKEIEDSSTEPGFVPAIYNGVTLTADGKFLELDSSPHFVSLLIAKAVPEIGGSASRERHAKTMEIAQEEVMICVGISLYERLNLLNSRFHQEERTWEILMCIGMRALRQAFDLAVEKKLGVSQLELFCEEISKEEKLQQQRKESKKQKRRRRKQKKADEVSRYELLEQDNISNAPEEEESKAENTLEENTQEDNTVDCENDNQPPEPKNKKQKSGKGKNKSVNKNSPEEEIKPLVKSEVLSSNSLWAPDWWLPIPTTKPVPIHEQSVLRSLMRDRGYSSENIKDNISTDSSSASELASSDSLCNHDTATCSTPINQETDSISRFYTGPRPPNTYLSLLEQLDDSSELEKDERIPQEEELLYLITSRPWVEKRAQLRTDLLRNFAKMTSISINIPSRPLCEQLNLRSHCTQCVFHDETENVPPASQSSNKEGQKEENECQSNRGAAMTTKGRTGKKAQRNRRYKGKNRR